MKITKRQLRRVIREALEHEDPEVVRAAEAIAVAIDGSNIRKGAAAHAFGRVVSDALSDFATDRDFLAAVENHFRVNAKTGHYSDRAVWAGAASIGSMLAHRTPGFGAARRSGDIHGS